MRIKKIEINLRALHKILSHLSEEIAETLYVCSDKAIMDLGEHGEFLNIYISNQEFPEIESLADATIFNPEINLKDVKILGKSLDEIAKIRKRIERELYLENKEKE